MPPITTDEYREFARKMAPLYRALSFEIRKNVERGMSSAAAVNAAAATVAFKSRFTDQVFINIFNSLERAMRTPGAIAKPIAMRTWWLNKKWPGEKLTLADSINNLVRMDEIKESIRIGMKAQKTWTEISKSLTDKQLQSGNIAGHIKNLENSARRVMAGDPEALAAYRKAVRKSKREIERLAKAGAPSKRLKKAYQNIIVQTEKRSISGLNKALDRAIVAKMQSNSDRIARTEIARGYIGGTYEDVIDDEDAIGMCYHLSPRHPEVDICDFHTGADLYNLGPGCYPLNNLPEYPFHPNCLCTATKLYRGDVKPFDNDKAKAFLNKQPAKNKKLLLGAAGAKNFSKHPNTWKKNLKHFQGYQTIGQLRGRVPTKAIISK